VEVGVEPLFIIDASESFRNGVNNFLVLSPETCPFEVIDVLRRALRENELPQRFNHTPSPHDAYDVNDK
jgi:hypothetical protein